MNVDTLITIVDIAILFVTMLFSSIYLLPIVVVRRFHTAANILTGNVCLTTFLGALFWIIDWILRSFSPTFLDLSATSCVLLIYCESMFNGLIIYALVMITVNRFFVARYSAEHFFRSKTWPTLLAGSQWVLVLALFTLQAVFSVRVSADNRSWRDNNGSKVHLCLSRSVLLPIRRCRFPCTICG